MIAYGEQSKGLNMGLSSQRIECGRFHFDSQNAVFAQLVAVDFIVIEAVDRDDIADCSAQVQLFRVRYGLGKQVEVCQRCIVDGAAEDIFDDGGIRAGPPVRSVRRAA